MSSAHPGLVRYPDAIVIRVPRGPCGVDPSAGDELRLRFVRADSVEERSVRLRGGGPADVTAGRAGYPAEPATDVQLAVDAGSVRLRLAADSFAAAPGVLLEARPAGGSRIGPAWLLIWGQEATPVNPSRGSAR